MFEITVMIGIVVGLSQIGKQLITDKICSVTKFNAWHYARRFIYGRRYQNKCIPGNHH